MTMKDNEDLKNKLTPEEFYVTQNQGTEPAFLENMMVLRYQELIIA